MDQTLQEFLEKHLPAKTKEKGELGEVFTPLEMIEELLDQFPEEIWTNKEARWLDPAAGIGNFPICVFFRYMKSLQKLIPSEEKRAKHIVENMLFLVEINPANTKIAKQLFKHLSPSSTPNIQESDFLEFKRTDPFTVVLGNPPYNLTGTKREGTKRVHIDFTEKALELIEKGGIVSFICPPSYRETDSPMNDLFQEAKGYLKYIKIYGANETHKIFRIQGRVDSFIFIKGEKGETHVVDEYKQVYDGPVSLESTIPNFGFSIFEKLRKKVKELGHIEAFRNTELTTVKADSFGQGSTKVLHLIVKEGRRVYKTNKKHSLLHEPKLLLNGLGIPYVYYDKEGKYAPSQTPVIVLNPTDSLARFMKSELFQCICWGMRLTGNNNLPYLFESVPDVRKVKIKNFEDFLSLTKEEKTFIHENFPVPTFVDKDILQKSASKTRKISKNKKGGFLF